MVSRLSSAVEAEGFELGRPLHHRDGRSLFDVHKDLKVFDVHHITSHVNRMRSCLKCVDQFPKERFFFRDRTYAFNVVLESHPFSQTNLKFEPNFPALSVA